MTPANLGDWPDLTNAIHWVVDDTWWDRRDPADDVGRLLVSSDEVVAVRALLRPLLAILDELGPEAPDLRYVQHVAWPAVTAAALDAHHLMQQR